MNDQICFVQFIHPGGEHSPDDGLSKLWNQGAHKRKFLCNGGKAISRSGTYTGDIAFWSEWEPESTVIEQIFQPLPFGPHYIYKPYYTHPESCEKPQNTDPFVFGKQFHYTGCMQHTKRGATQMRHLNPGSVILFGSCVNRQFALDTVFVVSHWIDHDYQTCKDVLNNTISQTYADVVITPWYSNIQALLWRNIGESRRWHVQLLSMLTLCRRKTRV